MNNIRIFYNISKKYWVELSHPKSEIIRFCKMNIPKLEFSDNNVMNGEKINSFSDLGCAVEKEYQLTLLDNNIFYLTEYNIETNQEIIRLIAENVCNKFCLQRKRELLKKVFTDGCSINQTLDVIKEYIFCDDYSLWLYNSTTKYFTHLYSSFQPKKTFLKAKDIKLHEGKTHICDDFDKSKIDSTLKHIKSFNRVKIELTSTSNGDNSDFLNVGFFSKRDDYSLKDETVELIIEILNLKYSKDHFSKILKSNQIVANLRTKFRIKEFDDYLTSCVSTITNELGWEAASIFIKDNNNGLKLKALQHFGDYSLIDSTIYTKGDGSITYYRIFEKNDLKNGIFYDYEINKNPDNTHKFDEVPRPGSESRNWIGIPILAPHIEPVGVLRVLNKLNANQQIINFDNRDITILKNLAENIAYQYNTEQKFIKEEDFIRTSRHEINTPLSFITLVTTRLRNNIRNEYGLKDGELPKKIRELLEDLKSVATRLSFVSQSKSFDAKELVREIKRALVFENVVIPIISFSKVYAIREKKYIYINKNSILHLPPVNCDIYSSQMALHIIVDNAIKYSKDGTTISVYGKEERDFCKVIIESDSIVPIRKEDKDKIFEKYYRTKEVELKKIEGSGIGLYLAQDIMRINGGKILLTHYLDNPIRFELHFEKSTY